MRFTVVSDPIIEGKLALIWLQAADKDAVTQESNQIDQILRFSPLARGEDKGDCRILTIGSLTVLYTVSQDDCKVTIHDYFYDE